MGLFSKKKNEEPAPVKYKTTKLSEASVTIVYRQSTDSYIDIKETPPIICSCEPWVGDGVLFMTMKDDNSTFGVPLDNILYYISIPKYEEVEVVSYGF